MIAVTDKTVIPELQHWFHHYVTRAAINKYLVQPPTDIDPLFLGVNSFIEMLFNEDFAGNIYKSDYIEESFGLWPSVVVRRVQIYPGAKYLSQAVDGDERAEDIWNFTNEEKAMLDALLAYRMDSTSLSFVDSTTTISFDSTATILYANINNFTSKLAKLIYIYLDLKVNGNIANYNNLDLVSTGGLLSALYELYVINEFFRHTTDSEIDLRPVT